MVLVGDRKVGEEENYTDKIRQTDFTDAVFAAAGLEGLFEDFLTELPKIVERNQDKLNAKGSNYTLFNFKEDCIALIKRTKKSFCSEIQTDSPAVQVLFAVNNKQNNKSELYYLDSLNCFTQKIKERQPIGQGYLGEIFLKRWNRIMTMKETARLGALIIKYIEKERVSKSVGVGKYLQPQIWFVKDGKLPRELTKNEAKKCLTGLKAEIVNVRNTIDSWVFSVSK